MPRTTATEYAETEGGTRTKTANRTLTTAQRGRFSSLSKSILNKALHTLGRDAEEVFTDKISNEEDGTVVARGVFKLGEVTYTITIEGRREEAS